MEKSMANFANPLNFVSWREDFIWYVHAFLMIPNVAFIALCPIKAITVWHSAYTVQLNLGQAFNTSLSLSGFTRKNRKPESLQACCQMQAKLCLIIITVPGLPTANFMGNGYCEDSTVRQIGLFFNLHHSDSDSGGWAG
jgi:hypothetical protein